jgi:hypothetical protein
MLDGDRFELLPSGDQGEQVQAVRFGVIDLRFTVPDGAARDFLAQ